MKTGINTEINGSTIFIPNGDHDIPAQVEMPADATSKKRVPAVVMLHGSGSQKDEVGGSYTRLARLLARDGFASIRIDFVGHGESKGFDGDFNFGNARSDILAATEYIQNRIGIDPERIGLIGWSQGATHAYLAAAYEKHYRSIVSWAGGAWRLEQIASPEIQAEADKNGYGSMNLDWRPPMHIGIQWIRDARALDLMQEMPKIKIPLLAVIGTEDDFFPCKNVASLLAACGNKDSKMYAIQGADHIFQSLSADTSAFYQAVDATIKWLKETL